jgi:hypothetical protein
MEQIKMNEWMNEWMNDFSVWAIEDIRASDRAAAMTGEYLLVTEVRKLFQGPCRYRAPAVEQVPGLPATSISPYNASLAKIMIRKLNARTPSRNIRLRNTLILLLFFAPSYCIPQSVQTQREAFCGYSQASHIQSFFVKS